MSVTKSPPHKSPHNTSLPHAALPHDAARLHVTGQARYVDDMPMPAGTLHLAFGLSPKACGTITTLDLDAVHAAPGVVAVLTADDLPFANDVSPSAHDEPLLATGTVHYKGQPVFLVVAHSHLAARFAARQGKIEVAEGTPILSIDAALAANSRFEDGPRIYQRGDAATGLGGAKHRLTGTLHIGGQEHFYLEGQAALALPGEAGDMHVMSSTQHPTEIQHKVADAIGLPMHAVRAETRRMGGGFGGKESQGNALAVACAIAARLTGQPCKMRYDRDDDMIVTGKRHDFRIDYDVGFDGAGLITALDVRHYTRCGWALDLSLPVADRAMLHADNAYWLPDIRIESHRLKTNTQSATAFRGFGGPQGMLGMERIVDHVAATLGLDPLVVRQLNFYRSAGPGNAEPPAPPNDPSPAPHQSFTRALNPGTPSDADLQAKQPPPGNSTPPPTDIQTTPYGQPVVDFILPGLVDKLVASSDYHARRAAVARWNADNPVLKKGIALSPVKFGISFTLTHLNQAGALVHVYADGSIHLNHGGTEMGQGLFQKVAQVAASRFGVALAAVRITATDTAKVPNTSATAASSGTDLNGMAVKAACDTIRTRMAEHLAQLHQCRPDAVVFAAGRVTAGAGSYSFAEVAALAHQARISLSATGFYKTPDIQWDRIKGQGQPFFYFAYGAAVTEVVIDTLTGENRILRADVLHDAGASLNPAIDIGQVEGGYVQGAGWLTTEELVWDDQGGLRTHAPSTYKIPACGDRPDVFNVALWEGENRADTIYKSKAVGEPPLMLGISAFLALSDAVSACGPHYPDLHAPATAQQILAATHRARG
jgi:xanthine dehydrogenase large subunit